MPPNQCWYQWHCNHVAQPIRQNAIPRDIATFVAGHGLGIEIFLECAALITLLMMSLADQLLARLVNHFCHS